MSIFVIGNLLKFNCDVLNIVLLVSFVFSSFVLEFFDALILVVSFKLFFESLLICPLNKAFLYSLFYLIINYFLFYLMDCSYFD